MRKITRFICVLLIFVMLFSTAVFASEDRASNYFGITSAYLSRIPGGFEIWFDVTAMGTMDQLGAKTVVVQRSSDGSSWTPVKTYTKEAYPEMIRTNFAAHTCCLTYTATAGYYYRAVVTFYAKKGTGSGELTQYTSSLKL